MYDVIRITVKDPRRATKNSGAFIEYSARLADSLKHLFGDDLLFVHSVADDNTHSITADFSGLVDSRNDEATVIGHTKTLRFAIANMTGVRLEQ